MGKTGRWFKSLLGGKKKGESPATTSVSDSKPAKEKNRWSFVRSFRDKTRSVSVPVTGDEKRRSYRENSSYSYVDDIDQTKHAIAVAAATAAVAEAALAAAQAATAVVRLTNSRRCTTAYVSGSDRKREYLAVVKIQASFRGYLARRALMALKGLVKLQALVRGHIVRKKTAEKLKYMQGLVPVQAQKQSGRGLISDYGYPIKQQSSLQHRHHHHSRPSTPEKREHMIRSKSTRIDHSMTLKRNGSKSSSRYGIDHNPTQLGSNRRSHRVEEHSSDHHKEDEKHDKILEIDMGKPHYNSKPRNIYHFRHHSFSSDRISHSFTTLDSPSKDSTIAQQSIPSSSSGEVQSSRPRNFHHDVDDTFFGTANNSPQCNAKRRPFTPTWSDTQSFLSGYSDNPNYMANTESSRAKVRPQSVPKQRLEFGKSGSINRVPIHGFSDVRSSAQRALALHLSFTDKAYPGSGRLDRLGMPIRDRDVY